MRYVLSALTLLIVAGCGGGNESANFTELHTDPACDITAGPCVATGDDGLRIELQLPPAPVALKPIEVKVRTAGARVEAPVLDLSMIGMDMGDNRYRLLAQGDDAWRATVVLPICIQDRADWIAAVTFSARGGRYRARFPFSTGG